MHFHMLVGTRQSVIAFSVDGLEPSPHHKWRSIICFNLRAPCFLNAQLTMNILLQQVR